MSWLNNNVEIIRCFRLWFQEWKIIYVGSAESEEFDQVLDTVYVGPVPEGRHKVRVLFQLLFF